MGVNVFHKRAPPLLRASSRGWIWTRSCMWVVTPTTLSSPKPLASRLVLLVRYCSIYTSPEEKVFFVWNSGLISPLCRLHPSAGHPRRGSDLQRSRPQLHWCHKLSHLQRPPMPGQLHPSAWCFCSIWYVSHFIISISSMLLLRMEGLVRTRRPACTSAAAPEDSRAATASTTHPCTVTQVQTLSGQQAPGVASSF